jgi:putative hemolysin
MPLLAEFLAIAIVLALTAVLAAYETAISAVTLARLVALEKANVHGATAAVAMKRAIERTLAVVQLGMTFSNAIAGAFGGATVEESFAPWLVRELRFSPAAAHSVALAAVVIPLGVLTVVFAELAPKVLAIRHKEGVACALSPAMRELARLLAPFATLLESVVKGVLRIASRARGKRGAAAVEATMLHELTAVAALARTANLIGAREERIVASAAQLSSRSLDEIELPAADISLLPSDATLETALVRAHLDMHTRFPVARVESDPQTIEGYVTFKDLVAMLKMADGTSGLRAITRPIKRIARTTTIAKALDTLVRERSHIALVVSDDDRVTGLVTLEDIIEELVGDIEDEFDRLPSHCTPAGDGFIVGGGITLEALHRRLDLPPPHANATLADWAQQQLAKAPTGGEAIAADGMQVLVRKLRRKRVAEAFVRRAAKEARV